MEVTFSTRYDSKQWMLVIARETELNLFELNFVDG